MQKASAVTAGHLSDIQIEHLSKTSGFVTVGLIYTCANEVSVPYVNGCTTKSPKRCITEADSKIKYLCYL